MGSNRMLGVYKVVRSVLFTLFIVVFAVGAILYTLLAIPPVQEHIKSVAEKELTAFLGNPVNIGRLSISPLNEVIIEDARFTDGEGKTCLDVGRLGAGINIWRLIFSQEIEITYIELLDFKGNVYQKAEGEPLNIDYIIQAFKPKEKNKPPTRFDLKIHNIVVREGTVSFSRLWKAPGEPGRFDPNHIGVEGLSADITIPRLSNDDTEIDLRRLSLSEQSGLQVREIGGRFHLTPTRIDVRDFIIRLPETAICAEDFSLPTAMLNGGKDYSPVRIEITDSKLTPSNLSAFWAPLSTIDTALGLKLTLTATPGSIAVEDFELDGPGGTLLRADGSLNQENREIRLEQLNLSIDSEGAAWIASVLPPGAASNPIAAKALQTLPPLSLSASGEYAEESGAFSIESRLRATAAEIEIAADGRIAEKRIEGDLKLRVPILNFTELLPGVLGSNTIELVTDFDLDLSGELNTADLMKSAGNARFSIGRVEVMNRVIDSFAGELMKEGDRCELRIDVDDDNLNGTLEASALLAGADSEWELNAIIDDFDTFSSFMADDTASGYEMKGKIEARARGNSIDNLTGRLRLTDFEAHNAAGKSISADNLSLSITEDEGKKSIRLRSGIADLNLDGEFTPSLLPLMARRTLGEICPAIFAPVTDDRTCGSGIFKLYVKDAGELTDFFNVPVMPLTELTLTGEFDSRTDKIELRTEIPYIEQQGNKLITDTYLILNVIGAEGFAGLNAGTVYPTKKGRLKIDLELSGNDGDYTIGIGLNRARDVMFYGDVMLRAALEKNPLTGQLEVTAHWLPSHLSLNDEEWDIDEAEIIYTRESLTVRDFCLRNATQLVAISGENTKEGEGVITVTLNDVNLDYIFDTLNINHVAFGGAATGLVTARDIFSADPQIHTERLHVDALKYNGALLGDAELTGRLDLPAKMVAIGAAIDEGGRRVAEADGGVWFGRDSLSFNFRADGVNIGFMQPFMQAFSSDVKGRASGEAHLYGTFSDIDMTGTMAAQDVEILIDFINARYTGSDTVYLTPGRILLPDFTVTDKFGHTAVVDGELQHRYFHDPVFNFHIKEMERLLVYDTNERLNPLWYGTIFASGSGEITGKPGSVNIAADVETEPGSDFTFVLSDQQEAVKSHFLTFTDRRKAAAQAAAAAAADTIPAFLRRYHETKKREEESSDIFTMDFRVSVNEDIRFNLIMDPAAGDKITAYGNGAMTLTYTSLTDEMRLYGKYILDRGSYNFSLQDIILKDFTIKPGSSISFTGDPYTGMLDITAAYRVNTSLTELDRSFANDRDLNRTSVPVEALLKVTGVLTSPSIGFDIDLPTVTEETAQKVRSIISTEDMMSRQVLYLVALNKFYPPEYMTTTNSGGEWASIASSTISSQIQNVIGQITDKFTVAPAIRSDKGDFSDIEFDLALSSQLFNNRLLLNGNFGYRDPSNSSTTFIGDFDLEYLLNSKGTWRLKAYNHFNDQNYYLKSALTTQGLGIVWRKEFGLPR